MPTIDLLSLLVFLSFCTYLKGVQIGKRHFVHLDLKSDAYSVSQVQVRDCRIDIFRAHLLVRVFEDREIKNYSIFRFRFVLRGGKTIFSHVKSDNTVTAFTFLM